jgi:pimeloyl-ACP methyl ester carboxylesterase
VVVGQSDRPIFIVPGFSGGILNKAPLAVDLASRGHQVIVPGENRSGLLVNSRGRCDATLSQAENLMAVLRAENLDDKPNSVYVIAHSYGSLIFEAMLKLATERGLPCFDNSSVVMTEPAGFIDYESLPRLAYGYLTDSFIERYFTEKDFPHTTQSLNAPRAYVLANKYRSFREVLDIAHHKIDYQTLLRSSIGSLAILSFARGRIFSSRAQQKTIREMLAMPDATVPFLWATPISLASDKQGTSLRLGQDAMHNDDMINPSRVGGAIAQLI